MDQTVDTHQSWFGLETLFARGHLGVDFFFILSGFIIHHVYRNVFATGVSGHDARRFVLYRFARVWPLHIVTMLGALALYAAAVLVFKRTPADVASYSPVSLLANVGMVQSWFGFGSPNVPAWSISAEWAAYLAFPFLCWALLRLPVLGWAGVALVACLLTGTEFVTHPLGRIACGFILGICLREAEGQFGLARHFGRWSGLVVVAALAGSCWVLPETTLIPYVAGFSLLILALSNPRDLLGRAAARPWMVYLGEISFALYMCHAVVWSAFKNIIRIALPGINPVSYVPVLAGTALSLVTAAALYRWVEVPGRDLLRGGRKRPPQHRAPSVDERQAALETPRNSTAETQQTR